MATKNVSEEIGKDLALYWKEPVTNFIANEFRADETGARRVLLNLASEEYSAAIDEKLLPSDIKVVKVVFQQEGRVISTHAKRARGLMARYLADVGATSVEQVQGFQFDGYAFVKNKSDEFTLVFNRRKPVVTTTPSTRQKRPASTPAAKGGKKTKGKR